MPDDDAIDPALLEQMRQLVNQEADRYLSRDLTRTVKQALTKITMQYLGISDKWQRLELTKDGADRLQQYLKGETKQRCDRYWDQILQEALTRLEQDGELHERLVRLALETMERQASSTMADHATKLGEQLAQRLMQQVQSDLSGQPPDLLGSTDPADPESFNGPLGRRLMRQLAQQLVQGGD